MANHPVESKDVVMLKDWITPLVRENKHTCDFCDSRYNGSNKCGKKVTHRLQWGFSYSYLCEEHAKVN